VDGRPFHILIVRNVLPEHRAAFDEVVRGWIQVAIQHPGYLGVMIHEAVPEGTEYAAVLRFRSEKDWHHFRAWPAYHEFLNRIRPMLIDEPRVEHLHGLEGWFPSAAVDPPRWKMAVITWLGVNAMVWLASTAVGALGESWPAWLAFLLINAIVVAGLTWAVMPLLTRAFAPWLKGNAA
jgi:antibiotic biosynthesis monooxygenase (ABM) superfamily enzyme